MTDLPKTLSELTQTSGEICRLLEGKEVWDILALPSSSFPTWLGDFFDAIDSQGNQTQVRYHLFDIGKSSTEADFDRKVRQLVPLSLTPAPVHESLEDYITDVSGYLHGVIEWTRGVLAVVVLFMVAGVTEQKIAQWLGVTTNGELPAFEPPESLRNKADAEYDAGTKDQNYTHALACYTAIGAEPLEKGEDALARERVFDIYRTRAENMRTLPFAAALLVGLIVFTSVFNVNVATHESVAAPAVICLLFSFGVLGFGFYRFKKRPFDGLTTLVPTLFFIWLVFAVLAI